MLFSNLDITCNLDIAIKAFKISQKNTKNATYVQVSHLRLVLGKNLFYKNFVYFNIAQFKNICGYIFQMLRLVRYFNWNTYILLYF